jgi:hypothetical protein
MQFVPQPGCIPLHPLGLSDIFSGAVAVLRRNARTIFSLAAPVAILQAVLTTVVQVIAINTISRANAGGRSATNTADLGLTIQAEVEIVGIALIVTVFTAIVAGTVSAVVTEDVLGRRLGVRQVWDRIRPQIGRLVVVALIVGIVPGIGLLFCVVPGVLLWTIWTVAVPVLVVERTSISSALGRSRELVRGFFWRTFGFRALAYVAAGFAGLILNVPFELIGYAATGFQASFNSFSDTSTQTVPLAYAVITGIGAAVVATFTIPWQASVDSLIYVDLRMRKERLDLTLQQAALRLRGAN